MELFDIGSPENHEQFLIQKAKYFKIPIGGTMELLPLCNMTCRMCYIQKDYATMKEEGRMLTCDEWLEIAEDLKKSGILYILLTGGEPLLFPEFERLYTTLIQMGFVISINTNGTLINEHFVALFSKYPCRQLNITLYGKDDATYASLCGNECGYTQVFRNAQLLKAHKIPFRFNYTATPWNIDQLQDIMKIANELQVPLSCATYVFPSLYRDNTDSRLTAKECAKAMIDVAKVKNPSISMELHAKATLDSLRQPIRNEKSGFHCGAGYHGFWINWKGELTCCGMIDQPKLSLLSTSFQNAWDSISPSYRNLPLCEACENCLKRNLCKVCTAACYTETGSTCEKPQYLCDVVDELIHLLWPYLTEDEQKEYSKILNPDK